MSSTLEPKNQKTLNHNTGNLEKINAALAEIEYKESQAAESARPQGNYIRLQNDKDRVVLEFTGQFEQKQMPVKDWQTGQITNKKATRYFFYCQDVTDSNNPLIPECIIERGPNDAKTILYYLSKNKNTLEITRHGVRGNKNTTYTIMPV